MEYRQLTQEEIALLEERGCKVEDWDLVTVAPGLTANYIRNTIDARDMYDLAFSVMG